MAELQGQLENQRNHYYYAIRPLIQRLRKILVLFSLPFGHYFVVAPSPPIAPTRPGGTAPTPPDGTDPPTPPPPDSNSDGGK